MTVSFSEPEVVNRLRSKKLLYLLIIANVAFASAILVFWTTSALLVEAPLSWGISATIERDSSWRSAFTYPYILLWAMPTIAALAAQIVQRAGNHRLATFVVMTPLLVFALTFAVFHLAPIEWR